MTAPARTAGAERRNLPGRQVWIWYIGIDLNAATSIPRSPRIACTHFGVRPMPLANGGAKVDHGSGGMVPLRRGKTLPVWQPFPVVGRAGGFTPWSCIARSVWRAGTG